MKRKLAQKDCVFCLRGEEVVFVDTSQFEYLATCQETERSVAVCLVPHSETKNDVFMHHPIPCEISDPDNFVGFVMGKKCEPDTDFVKWKQVLDFLGASDNVVDRLRACARASTTGVYSAWKAFGIQCQDLALVKQVPVTHDHIDFFWAHYCFDLLLPEEPVDRPTCMPEELVNLMDVQIAAFNGSALFPNRKFVPSARVIIDVLKTNGQLENCKSILHILFNNNYVVIEEDLNVWLCVPPAKTHWSSVYVKAGVKASLLDDIVSLQVDTGFVYMSSKTLQATIDTKYDLKFGIDYVNCHQAIPDFLAGLPIRPEKVTELKEANKWPIPQEDQDVRRLPDLMQSEDVPVHVFKRNLRYLRNVSVLDDCDSLKVNEDYRPARNARDFEASIKRVHQTLVSQHEFALCYASKVGSLFKLMNGKTYHVVLLRMSNKYSSLCRLLNKRYNQTFCENMGLVFGNLSDEHWIRCKISGYDDEGVLYWDAC
jgi:hypothetical protein